MYKRLQYSLLLTALCASFIYTTNPLALELKSPVISNPKKEKDVTKNFVYVTMPDGKYELIVEPALKSAAKALEYAYAKPGTKQLRRLMPRQLTGFISKKLGSAESKIDYEKTAEKIADFFEDLGFIYNETKKTWQPKDSRTKAIVYGLGINPTEWLIPDDGFESYNEFFIKKLKKGSRPIASANNVLVAPADSKLSIVEHVSMQSGKTSFFKVKSKNFTLQKFLANKNMAKEFEGGTLLIFRLSPYNYHRFHFPIDAKPSKPTPIKGGYESVDPISYKTGINPLITNIRHVISLQTIFGKIVMVIVGAFGVGSIQETFKPGALYHKGDELGYFQYGGSTIALVLKKDAIAIDDKLLDNAREGYETAVKMGERIGTVKIQ